MRLAYISNDIKQNSSRGCLETTIRDHTRCLIWTPDKIGHTTMTSIVSELCYRFPRAQIPKSVHPQSPFVTSERHVQPDGCCFNPSSSFTSTQPQSPILLKSYPDTTLTFNSYSYPHPHPHPSHLHKHQPSTLPYCSPPCPLLTPPCFFFGSFSVLSHLFPDQAHFTGTVLCSPTLLEPTGWRACDSRFQRLCFLPSVACLVSSEQVWPGMWIGILYG